VPDVRARSCGVAGVSPRLIGRGGELALLRQALVNHPALVLIEGEPGIGKSRLVHEAVRHRPTGQRVLFGHCHRLREPFLLGPVVEALRGLGDEPLGRSMNPVTGALRPLLPELVEALPPQPASTGDARADRHRVFRALRALLGALGPTVCLLEDLHWADEGTFEFLSFLLADPPEELVLVLTARDDDLPALSSLRATASRLPQATFHAAAELSPLTAEDVRELVSAIVPVEAVSEEFARDLHQRTAGIPFLVEEVLRMSGEQDQLVVDRAIPGPASGRLGVPAVVRHSIRDRMEPLGADARLIARAAAVLGVCADEDLLAKVAGLPGRRASRGLTEALALDLLYDKGQGLAGFRHALAAEAVYSEIPSREQRRLHLRAGRALERVEPRPLAQLAHHFKEANVPRRWTRYAQAAADAATALGNFREAARQLEEALSSPGLARADRIQMTIKLGSAALSSVSPQNAVAILQRTLDEEPMPVAVRGELRLSLARLRSYVGDAAWREEMIRAIGELPERPELAAPAMVSLAWPTTEESLEDDLQWLDRAAETVARTHDPIVKNVVHSQRAAILLSVGDPAGWTEIAEVDQKPSSIPERMARMQACHNLAIVTLGLGYCQRAETLFAETVHIHDELEFAGLEPWIETTGIGLDWHLGRWAGLEARVRELVHGVTDRPALCLGNQLVLGSLLLAHGRVKQAERTFAAALELAGPNHWMASQVAASARLGRIRLARGDAVGAVRVCALGIETLKAKGIWVMGSELVPVAVRALLANGRRDRAADLVREFAEGLQGRDAPGARAASLACEAALAKADGRYGAAARLLGTAERRWRELPCPYEAAQVREERGRCLLAHQDAGGNDLLLAALKDFQALGASWDVGRVRAHLRAEGVSARPPSAGGGRLTYGNDLSPREAEVARLAAMGRKNREIAEALVLSPRTVEVHVAAAIRKLGVDSREALALAPIAQT